MTSFQATPAPSPLSRRSADGRPSPVLTSMRNEGRSALLVGNGEEVVDKIVRHREALGGISRLTFQMNAASLPHAKLMQAIEAIGTRVVPALRERLADESTLNETAVS